MVAPARFAAVSTTVSVSQRGIAQFLELPPGKNRNAVGTAKHLRANSPWLDTGYNPVGKIVGKWIS